MLHEGKTDHVIVLKDGRRLAYAEYGDPKGKPAFYFHGWPVSGSNAAKYDALAKKLHTRIISPDRPGYGYSDYKSDRTLLDWPDDVVELADHLKIKKFAVMGVSGGGPYAAVCAYKIPRRLTKAGIVVGLAPTWLPSMLDDLLWTAKWGWAHYGNYPIVRTAGALIHFFHARYGLSLGLHRFLFGSKTDRKIYADARVRKVEKATFQQAYRQGWKGPELDLKLYTTDWGFAVKNIKSKVFLWYGSEDKNVTLAMAKYYEKNINGSRLTVYPGEGHLISITHAEEILKALTS